MTRRRWIADEVSGNRAILTGSHAEHLARVLRARVGQEFDIATGLAVRKSRITSIAESRVEFELGEEVPSKAHWDRLRAKIGYEREVFGFETDRLKHIEVAEISGAVGQMLAGFRTALNNLPASAARCWRSMPSMSRFPGSASR